MPTNQPTYPVYKQTRPTNFLGLLTNILWCILFTSCLKEMRPPWNHISTTSEMAWPWCPRLFKPSFCSSGALQFCSFFLGGLHLSLYPLSSRIRTYWPGPEDRCSAGVLLHLLVELPQKVSVGRSFAELDHQRGPCTLVIFFKCFFSRYFDDVTLAEKVYSLP